MGHGAGGTGLRQGLGLGPTCPVFHVLHLHDFSVDSAPEDVEGAVDGFGPLGGFLAPSDPERQWEVNIPHAPPQRSASVFNRAEGEGAGTGRGTGMGGVLPPARSMGFSLVVV